MVENEEHRARAWRRAMVLCAFMFLAGSGLTAAADATGPDVTGPVGGLVSDLTSLVFVDGDHVVFDAKGTGAGGSGVVERDGFATYGDARVLESYRILLVASDGIDHFRPFVETAAAAAVAAGAPTLTVADGVVPFGTEPRRGEIHVTVSGAAPCPGSWLGCGGPIIDDDRVEAGRMWLHPRLAGRAPEDIDNTVRHELGHTLGLGHYANEHGGRVQTMHPTRFDARSYESGDRSGFAFVMGRPVLVATPAPTPASPPPPAPESSGQAPAEEAPAPPPAPRSVDPLGALESVGSTPLGLVVRGWASDPDGTTPVRVLVTVDGAPFEVVAHRARPDGGPVDGFDLSVSEPPGSYEVCVTLRNQALGADTALGCQQVGVSDRSIGSVGLQTL